MERRKFLQNAGFTMLSLALGGRIRAEPNSGSRKPNILVILVDDLGYGDLSSYGAGDIRTPNIDKLISTGMRFDNFYANCPVCSPTRASVLTGCYPDMVGVPGVIRTHIKDSWGWLSSHAVLLPEVLKEGGYHTAIVGKWHLGLESPNKPNERGFDYFWGFLGDMMDDYYTHRRFGHNYMRCNDKVIDPSGHATDLFTRASVEYIRERAGHSQPFFLYLAYNAPHSPIQPPPEWLAKVKDREKGITEKRARIVALIEHLDDGIGNVLQALQATGQADNTLIIFTSDNGGDIHAGATNGPLRGGKGGMYEGGIKEPMGIVWPGRIKGGSRSNRIALTMDIFPTVCEAAGVKIKHPIDGRSFLATALGREQLPEKRYLFWVRREGNRYGGRAFYAARYGDWKLLQNSPFEPMRLYNLHDDPHEDNPLGKRYPMYNKLFTALRGHVCRSGALPWQKYPVELNRSR